MKIVGGSGDSRPSPTEGNRPPSAPDPSDPKCLICFRTIDDPFSAWPETGPPQVHNDCLRGLVEGLG